VRAEYDQRIKEWREHVDPVILRELNRRRAAKGMTRRNRGLSTGRPMSGFLRYVYESTHPMAIALSKILAISTGYGKSTHGQRMTRKLISRAWPDGPQVSGSH
jgi:hypothetical protein